MQGSPQGRCGTSADALILLLKRQSSHFQIQRAKMHRIFHADAVAASTCYGIDLVQHGSADRIRWQWPLDAETQVIGLKFCCDCCTCLFVASRRHDEATPPTRGNVSAEEMKALTVARIRTEAARVEQRNVVDEIAVDVVLFD